MTEEQRQLLSRGDIVRHKSGESYVILRNDGRFIIAVRTVEITNTAEWELVGTNSLSALNDCNERKSK